MSCIHCALWSSSQELPEQWNNVKKQAVLMKQGVAPLQATEVGIIRRKLASFDVKQHEFREAFRNTAPFNFTSLRMYRSIDLVSGWGCSLLKSC